ncbi:UNVERIFIED_CONTAM: hypothetical protein K2H54_074171 [Gekko kuhli]
MIEKESASCSPPLKKSSLELTKQHHQRRAHVPCEGDGTDTVQYAANVTFSTVFISAFSRLSRTNTMPSNSCGCLQRGTSAASSPATMRVTAVPSLHKSDMAWNGPEHAPRFPVQSLFRAT